MDGVDANFLYMETPSVHMHTLKMAVLEPTPGLTAETLVGETLARLRRLPPFRQAIVPVPFQLNHPVEVTLDRLDPRRHFFTHRVPGDGTDADLHRVIGRIASTPLDRSVPLWELHMCEGLEGGRVAMVAKIHHALADGMAANALLANITNVRSADEVAPAPAPAVAANAIPSSGWLVVDALVDAARQLFTVPDLVRRVVHGIGRVLRYRRRERPGTPLPLVDAPRTSLNGSLTPRRSFAMVTLPLEDCKRVRRQYEGVSFNDVVVAIIAGALRRMFAERGEVHRKSLIAGVPVGLDAPGAIRLQGNNVSNFFTTMATNIDDVDERMAAIAESSRHAKRMQQEFGPTMLGELTQFTPPAPMAWFLRAYGRLRAAGWHRPPINMVVSNVPGPREPVSIGGGRLADLFSVGPLVDGVGLNVTVWSYVDRMNFSLLACPDLLPDVAGLAAHFPAALAELDKEQPPGGVDRHHDDDSPDEAIA